MTRSSLLVFKPHWSSRHKDIWSKWVSYASFGRYGGVSSPPYDTLNLSFSVGDQHEDVAANLDIVKRHMGASQILMAKQVHGTDIFNPAGQDFSHPVVSVGSYDGLVTDISGSALLIKHADCQSVAFFDPEHKVIANVHAGWRGLTGGILQNTVKEMQATYSCNPSMLMAVISPSLGPCCFEFRGWKTELPEYFHEFMENSCYFNAWRASHRVLTDLGLKDENIFTIRICSRCSGLHFSYRRDRITGRCATLIMLKRKASSL